MNRFLALGVFSVLVAPAVSLAANYEEKNERPDAPLAAAAAAAKDMPIGAGFKASLGGSAQHRYQSFDNLVNYFAGTADAASSSGHSHDLSLFARERVNLEIHHDCGLRFFLEAQDAREFSHGRPASPVATENFLDLYQGYLDFGFRPDIVDKPTLQFRVGRQELELGNGHFFSAQDWNNTGQNFDLARADWRPDGFELTTFAGWPLDAARRKFDVPSGETIAGANLKAVGIPFGHIVEGRLLYKWDERTTVAGERGTTGPERRWTLGSQARGHFLTTWDYTLDASYQTGSSGGSNIRAWNAYGEAGWTYRFKWRSLRVAAQYSQSSGDRNPADGTVQTFDPLFADQYLFHGKLLIAGDRNLEDFNPKAQARLWRGGLIQLDYHLFRLNQARDALYRAYEDTVRHDPTGRAGQDAGQEIDLQIFHNFNDNLSLGGGMFLFDPGSLFGESEGPRVHPARSFFIMLKTSF
ncbi:MAG TPA: alginate export family protein [Planctomycetota bacterium]|jgi:hypothetical protein